jgi:antitoxin (DNA-binding transcriptional repressor) of toxin-antitoxin stability system
VAAQFDGRQQVVLLVIARSGVPIARLVAWQAPARSVAPPGAMRGRIQLSDDFDAPLDGLFEALQ